MNCTRSGTSWTIEPIQDPEQAQHEIPKDQEAYTWSGSGWQVGAPKRLNSVPILGFPSYDNAKMVTVGLIAEF